MIDNLTLEALADVRASLGYTRGVQIRVFDFREQWRFPRTKKRRIRKKWAKRKSNWRLKLGQCYEVNLPGHPLVFVVGPDVKRKLDQLSS